MQARQEALEDSERKKFEEEERRALEKAKTLDEEAKRWSTEAATFAEEADALEREAEVIAAKVNPRDIDVTSLDMPADLQTLLDNFSRGQCSFISNTTTQRSLTQRFTYPYEAFLNEFLWPMC